MDYMGLLPNDVEKQVIDFSENIQMSLVSKKYNNEIAWTQKHRSLYLYKYFTCFFPKEIATQAQQRINSISEAIQRGEIHLSGSLKIRGMYLSHLPDILKQTSLRVELLLIGEEDVMCANEHQYTGFLSRIQSVHLGSKIQPGGAQLLKQLGEVLEKTSTIEELRFCNTGLSGQELQIQKPLQSLKVLRVENESELFTNGNSRAIFNNFPSLEKLGISNTLYMDRLPKSRNPIKELSFYDDNPLTFTEYRVFLSIIPATKITLTKLGNTGEFLRGLKKGPIPSPFVTELHISKADLENVKNKLEIDSLSEENLKKALEPSFPNLGKVTIEFPPDE